MAAITLPAEPAFPERTWQSLVRDQRYRLFAAGNHRAAIAECLPMRTARAEVHCFDARYGLNSSTEAHSRLVLLTQVSRAFDPSANRTAPAASTDPGKSVPWRWEASHCIQPFSHLESYIDQQAGTLLFFLTRRAQTGGTSAESRHERIEDCAVRLGKSLGLDGENLEALRVAGLIHHLGRTDPSAAATGRVTAMHSLPPVPFEAQAEGEGGGCRSAGCGRPVAVSLQSEPYCKEHFIATCYERLDSCRESLARRRPSNGSGEQMRSFLNECVEQATALTRDPFHQDAFERARLLDILHTASDLGRHVRRSPRLPESVDIRLSCRTPGRPWEEEMHTLGISRYGAMLECQHLVRPGDWLLVERRDNGMQTRARMAWRAPAKSGHYALGLEFVDSENFWGLNWTDT